MLDGAAAEVIISDGISQDAYEAKTPTVSLNNSGTLTIMASASALAAANANAFAGIGHGIYQSADADGIGGGVANVNLINTGLFTIGATSFADPADCAVAGAQVGFADYGYGGLSSGNCSFTSASVAGSLA